MDNKNIEYVLLVKKLISKQKRREYNQTYYDKHRLRILQKAEKTLK